MNQRPSQAPLPGLQEEPFRLLVESVRDYAIFMLDPEGRVQTWNQGAARIKGYGADEIVGRHFSCFYPAEAVACGWPEFELREAAASGRFEDEGWRVRKDGHRFWANVVITALYDVDGRLRGYAKVTRDLTERRRAEAAEESKRRMTEFLAMLAHELRNPLAPLRNATEILHSRPEDLTTVRWAAVMLERQVGLLTRLVDDLLEASRVTSGKITIHKAPVELNGIARRAAESVRFAAEARGQRLSTCIAEEPVYVDGDGARLLQVALNLLNNAVKYTPEGGAIVCEAAREGDEAVLRVRDTGIGIAQETLPHVFELFVQGERSLDRSEGGLGIGLALVDRLVRQHGGRVEAHSGGRNCGAEFTVRLPALRTAPEETRSGAVPGEPGVAASRILIVDDHRDAADSMADLLRVWGSDVRVCYDGESALQLAPQFLPQVALLDIGLPRIDGYELARRLKAMRPLGGCALIAVTGFGGEEESQRAREAGFVQHFVKPVDPAALLELLARLRPYPNVNESAATAAPIAAPPSTSLG